MEQQRSMVAPISSLAALVEKLTDKKLRAVRERRRGVGWPEIARRLDEPLAIVKEWAADPVFQEAIRRAELDPEAFAEASAAANERRRLKRERAEQRYQEARAQRDREARAAEWWREDEEPQEATAEVQTDAPAQRPAPSAGATPEGTSVAARIPADLQVMSSAPREGTTVSGSADMTEAADRTLHQEDSPSASIGTDPGLESPEGPPPDSAAPGPTPVDSTIHMGAPGSQGGDDAGSARELEVSGSSPLPEGNQSLHMAAAGLLHDLGDPTQVNTAMGLPLGTVSAWLERQDFRGLVTWVGANRRAAERADVDVGRLLTPSQRRAAELIVEGEKQAHVARDLNVHRQTIRNWSKAPAFSRYIEQLEVARREAVRLGRQAEEEQQESKLRALEGRCWNALEEGMNPANPKMVLAVLGAIQRNRRRPGAG